MLFITLLGVKLLTHTLVATVNSSRAMPALAMPVPTYFSFLYIWAVSMNVYLSERAAETLEAHSSGLVFSHVPSPILGRGISMSPSIQLSINNLCHLHLHSMGLLPRSKGG